MRKAPINRGAILDRLHRGTVWVCIGLTVYGTYLTGARIYNYFTVVRPANKLKEIEMLREGAPEPIHMDMAKNLKL